MIYRIHGASVTGSSHIKNNIPCQDAFAFKTVGGAAVIAVADGLGSAAKSDIGALTAVNTVVNEVSTYLADHPAEEIDFPVLLKQSVYKVRESLEHASLEYDCNLKDLACTLISVILFDDTMIIAHIGDGAVIARKETGLLVASSPGESEYTNEVIPITASDWEREIRFSPLLAHLTDVMVTSDGCQRASLKKINGDFIPFDNFCEPVFSYFRALESDKNGMEDLRGFLTSRKLSENSDDDKTMVVINIEK